MDEDVILLIEKLALLVTRFFQFYFENFLFLLDERFLFIYVSAISDFCEVFLSPFGYTDNMASEALGALFYHLIIFLCHCLSDLAHAFSLEFLKTSSLSLSPIYHTNFILKDIYLWEFYRSLCLFIY